MHATFWSKYPHHNVNNAIPVWFQNVLYLDIVTKVLSIGIELRLRNLRIILTSTCITDIQTNVRLTFTTLVKTNLWLPPQDDSTWRTCPASTGRYPRAGGPTRARESCGNMPPSGVQSGSRSSPPLADTHKPRDVASSVLLRSWVSCEESWWSGGCC